MPLFNILHIRSTKAHVNSAVEVSRSLCFVHFLTDNPLKTVSQQFQGYALMSSFVVELKSADHLSYVNSFMLDLSRFSLPLVVPYLIISDPIKLRSINQ